MQVWSRDPTSDGNPKSEPRDYRFTSKEQGLLNPLPILQHVHKWMDLSIDFVVDLPMVGAHTGMSLLYARPATVYHARQQILASILVSALVCTTSRNTEIAHERISAEQLQLRELDYRRLSLWLITSSTSLQFLLTQFNIIIKCWRTDGGSGELWFSTVADFSGTSSRSNPWFSVQNNEWNNKLRVLNVHAALHFSDELQCSCLWIKTQVSSTPSVKCWDY